MPTSGKGRKRKIINKSPHSACEFDRHADPARSRTAGEMQCPPSCSVPDHPFLRPKAPFALSVLRSLFAFLDLKNMQQIRKESEAGFLPAGKDFHRELAIQTKAASDGDSLVWRRFWSAGLD